MLVFQKDKNLQNTYEIYNWNDSGTSRNSSHFFPLSFFIFFNSFLFHLCHGFFFFPFNLSYSHTNISTNSSLYGFFNSFLFIFTLLHVLWGSDPTVDVPAHNSIINIQRPRPSLSAFIPLHKHFSMLFFTSKVFSVLHMPCFFFWY